MQARYAIWNIIDARTRQPIQLGEIPPPIVKPEEPTWGSQRRKTRTILENGVSGHGLLRFVDLDPSGLILSWGLRDWLGAYRQAVFIAAPSMTTPAVTYFQRATSSFRASATIVVLRRRPPLRFTRSWNQRASAESG